MQDVVLFLARTQPSTAVLENVRGMLQTDRAMGDQMSPAALLKADLERLNYAVCIVESDLHQWHAIVRQRTARIVL